MSNTYTLKHSLNRGFEALLRTIQNTVSQTEVPFFIAGATARDIILYHVFGRPQGRKTYDIDTAILVSFWGEFNCVKEALLSQNMRETREAHRIIDIESGMPIDIIPFGDISDQQGDIAWPPEHSVTMSVAGFQEAYDSALVVDIGNSCLIKVASLAGLAMLKLIAWCDRHLETTKDATDFLTLLHQYEHIQQDRLYEEYIPADSMNHEPQRLGAYLLGYDMSILLNQASYKQLELVQTDLNELFITTLIRTSPESNAKDIEQMVNDFWHGVGH